MKTITNKTKMALMLAVLALGMNAQNTKMKACIKIDKDDNGKITKTDTCVTAATEAELQQKLNALGIVDLPELPPLPELDEVPSPPMPPTPPTPPKKGQRVTITKYIVIDDIDNEKNGSKKNK